MEELTFLVKGSSKDPYEVIFIKDGDSLTAICNCPAGTYGNFCKHRISILDGNAKAIVSDNTDQATKVITGLAGTDVEEARIEGESRRPHEALRPLWPLVATARIGQSVDEQLCLQARPRCVRELGELLQHLCRVVDRLQERADVFDELHL